jgi:hypothetical protein
LIGFRKKNLPSTLLPNAEQQSRFLEHTRVFSKNVKDWKGRKKPENHKKIETRIVNKLKDKLNIEKDLKKRKQLNEAIADELAGEEIQEALKTIKFKNGQKLFRCDFCFKKYNDFRLHRQRCQPNALKVRETCKECSEPFDDEQEHRKTCIYF